MWWGLSSTCWWTGAPITAYERFRPGNQAAPRRAAAPGGDHVAGRAGHPGDAWGPARLRDSTPEPVGVGGDPGVAVPSPGVRPPAGELDPVPGAGVAGRASRAARVFPGDPDRHGARGRG